jgi:hypothetical protein
LARRQSACKFNRTNLDRAIFGVCRLHLDVGNMRYLLCTGDATNGMSRLGMNYGRAV